MNTWQDVYIYRRRLYPTSTRNIKFGAVAKENIIQSNLDSSNTDGSFTMANSNSFLSPYEIHPIALKNKYLGKFSYFIVYVVEAILMSTLNIQLLCRK